MVAEKNKNANRNNKQQGPDHSYYRLSQKKPWSVPYFFFFVLHG